MRHSVSIDLYQPQQPHRLTRARGAAVRVVASGRLGVIDDDDERRYLVLFEDGSSAWLHPSAVVGVVS